MANKPTPVAIKRPINHPPGGGSHLLLALSNCESRDVSLGARFTVGFQGLHVERLRHAAPAQPGCSCQLATPLPRAIRSSATRRVGGAHAPAAQACYGIGRQGCNTLVLCMGSPRRRPHTPSSSPGKPRHQPAKCITQPTTFVRNATQYARARSKGPSAKRKDRLLAKSLPSVITP